MHQSFIRGQYGPGEVDGKELKGYRQEDNVDPHPIRKHLLQPNLKSIISAGLAYHFTFALVNVLRRKQRKLRFSLKMSH